MEGFTSVGDTVLVQQHDGASFEGIGEFEGTGTFNGTGRFVGSGTFSGEMVSPGSFYQTGIVPGEYEAFANLENGREVLLPQTVQVGITAEFGLTLSMPGSLITGNLTNATGGVLANTSFEIIDTLTEDANPVTVTTNETGGYKYGPISPGEYEYRIDLDADGFYEASGQLLVGDETELLEPLSIIPETFDVTINLVSPTDANGLALIDTANQNFSVTNILGISEDYVSDEDGTIDLELIVGEYTIEQSEYSEYYLYSKFSIVDENLIFDLEYSPATTISGTILAYTVDYDETWTDSDIAANTTAATLLDVSLSSGDVEFATETDADGNFSIIVPGDLVYVLKAATTGNTYGVGQYVQPNEQPMLDIGEIYLNKLTSVSGIITVADTNATWNAQNYDGLVPTIVATDNNGIEWQALVTNSGSFTVSLANGLYDFGSSEDEYNITVIEDYEVDNFVESSFISLTSDQEPVTLQFSVCLVLEKTGSCTDSIPKYADIQIISEFDDNTYTLNQSSFDDQGSSSIDLLPGLYTIQTNYTDADNENATDFNTFSTNQQIFASMFIEDNEVIFIEFVDERLFSGKMTVGAGNFSNVQFLLYNESKNQFLSATTDESGNFSEYIPAGDWLVIVSPQESDNTTYTLRYPISIDDDSEARTGIELALAEAVTVNMTLVESLTDNYVAVSYTHLTLPTKA